MRWFRFYDEVLDDPKVQCLKPEMFKMWVNLLCLASRSDGKLPNTDTIAFSLRMTPERARAAVNCLIDCGLLDGDVHGVTSPHNWGQRQYVSDSSVTRVQRFRERHRNGIGNGKRNVTATPPDTDSEAETEKKEGSSGASAPPQVVYAFEGKVIRLTHKDFANWKKAYSAIPDIFAELQRLDDYATSDPAFAGKWFFAVSGALKKRHEAALLERKKPALSSSGYVGLGSG